MKPPLLDLRMFVAVAKSGSFVKTAANFNVSPSVVSRTIAALEDRLSVRLITRTTRNIFLTPEGEDYLRSSDDIIARLDEAESNICSSASPRGELRLSVPISFARRQVAPICSRFRKRYPDVTIRLLVSDESNDLMSAGTDVALRVGLPQEGEFVTKRVLRARRAICASPQYLETVDKPRTTSQLVSLDGLIIVRDGKPLNNWMFEIDGSMETVRMPVTMASNSGEVIHEWALAGNGIALKSLWDVEADLAEGRLVELLRSTSRESADMFLIYPERRGMASRTRAFIDFLSVELGELDARLASI
ncbi:LysR family transcriptional regulator [Erythrobacter litoralis]|uniref:LysR family transcriptional regulator n=1 Tax=Erythrobacter litoralis TaxID=39960 RepID=UPI002435A110|nr:LysR family transcriptional regulator [Erythrobacter litoralis]MDG6080248.1 LysR family transcriptional regulator [Erythrobacter litoralis]